MIAGRRLARLESSSRNKQAQAFADEGSGYTYLWLVGNGGMGYSNSSYNCTPFLHSLLTKGKDIGLRFSSSGTENPGPNQAGKHKGPTFCLGFKGSGLGPYKGYSRELQQQDFCRFSCLPAAGIQVRPEQGGGVSAVLSSSM